MTWFKVDDGLHKHRKRVRAGVNLEGFAAIGLWTVAGSWSSDELTDGWIPDDVLDYIAPGVGHELAKRLEAVGLWHRVTRDGEEGWQFHEWTGHQPTKDQVLAERAGAADRQRRARERARANRSDQGQEDEMSRRDSRVTDDEVTPAVTAPPTRPDPSLELPSEVLFSAPPAQTGAKASKPTKRPSERGTRIPDDFGISQEMRQWATEEIPKFDIDREFPKFRDYWRSQSGQRGVRKEWPAVFRNWMRRASEQNPPAAYPDNRSHNGANGIALRDQQPRQSTGTQRMQQALDVAAQLDEQFATEGNNK